MTGISGSDGEAQRGKLPPQVRIVRMVIGPVPIVRWQLREVGTDLVLGSTVASSDHTKDAQRLRRAAERMGYVIIDDEAEENG